MSDLFPSTRHDAGGSRFLPLASGVIGDATFGGERDQYRYALSRIWDYSRVAVLFVMMNPSTADPNFDDPTIAKCQRFARAWKYGELLVGNTFAYRATDQAKLLTLGPEELVGPDNGMWLRRMCEAAGLIVMAYGSPRSPLLRAAQLRIARIMAANQRLHVLRLSKAGVPVHPLYLPETLRPQPWTPPNA